MCVDTRVLIHVCWNGEGGGTGTRTRIEMRVEGGDNPEPMKYEVVIRVIG